MMNFNRGLVLSGRCFEPGFFANGWNWLIGIGILLIIVVGIVLIATRNRKTSKDDSIFEALKLKYADGEISTEEYKKRKSILEEK